MPGGNWSLLVKVVTGEVVAASDRNNEYNNVITNDNQDGIASASEDILHMQATNNPAPGGTPSEATSGRGELEALRYMLSAMTAKPNWYTGPDITLATLYTQSLLTGSWKYRRPRLLWVSATTINIESGLDGISGDVVVIFPDGTTRTTNNSTYTLFNISRTAVLSGSKQSGIRSGVILSYGWLALYAVKSTDSTDIIVVGDSLFPSQANYAALNTAYGVNGWRYLGMCLLGTGIFGGTGILKFIQAGQWSYLYNTYGASHNNPGVGFLMTQAGGSSGTFLNLSSQVVLPPNLGLIKISICVRASATIGLTITGINSGITYAKLVVGNGIDTMVNITIPPSDAYQWTTTAGATSDDYLTAWCDTSLGESANELL